MDRIPGQRLEGEYHSGASIDPARLTEAPPSPHSEEATTGPAKYARTPTSVPTPIAARQVLRFRHTSLASHGIAAIVVFHPKVNAWAASFTFFTHHVQPQPSTVAVSFAFPAASAHSQPSVLPSALASVNRGGFVLTGAGI